MKNQVYLQDYCKSVDYLLITWTGLMLQLRLSRKSDATWSGKTTVLLADEKNSVLYVSKTKMAYVDLEGIDTVSGTKSSIF